MSRVVGAGREYTHGGPTKRTISCLSGGIRGVFVGLTSGTVYEHKPRSVPRDPLALPQTHDSPSTRCTAPHQTPR